MTLTNYDTDWDDEPPEDLDRALRRRLWTIDTIREEISYARDDVRQLERNISELQSTVVDVLLAQSRNNFRLGGSLVLIALALAAQLAVVLWFSISSGWLPNEWWWALVPSALLFVLLLKRWLF